MPCWSGPARRRSAATTSNTWRRVHAVLADTQEVTLAQAVPNGNASAKPGNPAFLDQCADAVVAVLRLTGTLI